MALETVSAPAESDPRRHPEIYELPRISLSTEYFSITSLWVVDKAKIFLAETILAADEGDVSG